MTDAMNRARELHSFHVWAYVLMPEHVHLLIWPTEEEYSISKILKCMKQSVATRALAYVKEHSPDLLYFFH